MYLHSLHKLQSFYFKINQEIIILNDSETIFEETLTTK